MQIAPIFKAKYPVFGCTKQLFSCLHSTQKGPISLYFGCMTSALPPQNGHGFGLISLMIEYPFPVVAMLVPSLDTLARQLHVVRPALVGKRTCEYIIDLREGVALRTPYFDGPTGSQVIIDYLDVQVLCRMALRARFHSRHLPSPLSLRMRSRILARTLFTHAQLFLSLINRHLPHANILPST